MPLIVETLLLCTAAYVLGIAVAALLFRPRHRGSFLED